MSAGKPSTNARDLLGQVFGRLTVIKKSDRRTKHRDVCWICQCSCGNIVDVIGKNLRNGTTVSCKCFHRDRNIEIKTIHGGFRTKIYGVWKQMVQRCHMKTNRNFKHYGGRGITVCQRWRDSFKAFVEDMGERPPGMTIERIDNNKGYSPENCRWATQGEQMNNTRRNILLTFNGVTMNRKEWANSLGISPNALKWRIDQWGLEIALTTHGPRTQATSPVREDQPSHSLSY